MIPKTMKAAVVREYGKPLQIEEVEVKRPGRNQVLVKVMACGVCHTELHAVDGDWPVKPKMPLIPGPEGVGYVVAVGEDVNNVKEGDAVGVPWLYSACGGCEYCITGWETLCDAQQNGGYSVDGSFAEYVIADARYVGHLPPGNFDLSIFDTVLNRITIRGSIVGTRKDLQEAIEFAAEGKVKANVSSAKLDDVNNVFDKMKKGQIEGRIVLDIAGQ